MLLSLPTGFLIDIIVGDPHGLPHPVIFIGKLISLFETQFRKAFSRTVKGERAAGLFVWILTVVISAAIPFLILWLCSFVSIWLVYAVESIFFWQMLAVKALKDETMKVYYALESGDIKRSRKAVSMIVGRDTDELDDAGVTRAAVETVAENTSDGIVAPILFASIGGAPLLFFYKAVNTMDSMLGYTEEPYKNVGFVPAKADDVFNFVPARISAILMLAAGRILKLDVKNGWKIFKRDRYNHASPNSAQTESVCAGLLRIRLGGDASYHGVLHKKKYIGDDLRPVRHDDIPGSCHLMFDTSLIMLVCGILIRFLILSLVIH